MGFLERTQRGRILRLLQICYAGMESVARGKKNRLIAHFDRSIRALRLDCGNVQSISIESGMLVSRHACLHVMGPRPYSVH